MRLCLTLPENYFVIEKHSLFQAVPFYCVHKEDARMTIRQRRISPDGRLIHIRQQMHVIPAWVARRRRAYRLIDAIAENGKRAVRKLVPRPRKRGQSTPAGAA